MAKKFKLSDDLKMLVDPVFTSPVLSKCAPTFTCLQITRAWLEKGKNRRVYLLLPDPEYSFTVDVDIDHPRIIPLYVKRRSCRYRETWLPTDEVQNIAKEWGPYGDWDVLLTNRNNALWWRRITNTTGPLQKYMVLYETFPFLPFKETIACKRGTIDEATLSLSTLSSYMAFHQSFIQADWEKQGIITEAKKWFSPSRVRELSEKLVVTWPSHPLDDNYPLSDEAYDSFMEQSPFKVIFSQRVQITTRRFDLVHDTLKAIHAKLIPDGYDLKVKLFTNSLNMIPEYANDYKFLDVEHPKREEFWELAKDANVFISFSRTEGLPKGLVELLKLGVIGVMIDAKWSRSLCGVEYPFYVKNTVEAIAKISWIYKNREDAYLLFVTWYEDYFIPNILQKADTNELFERSMLEFFMEQNKGDKITNTIKTLMGELDRLKIKKINLMKVPAEVKLPSMAGVDILEYDYFKSAKYHKHLPWRWRMFWRLRRDFGWKTTHIPWELVRK